MKTKFLFFIAISILLLGSAVYDGYLKRLSQPIIKADLGCVWSNMEFKHINITAFVQKCDSSTEWMTFQEYSTDTINGVSKDNPSYKFQIKIFSKKTTEQPIDVVKNWYKNLDLEQQKNCEIKNADEQKTKFNLNTPYLTPHKTRYKIDLKKEVTDAIFKKYGGLPGNQDYDYMCGHTVGTSFTAHPPYFEFDDRNPSKYLFVGSYGQEAPLIDLNSIRF